MDEETKRAGKTKFPAGADPLQGLGTGEDPTPPPPPENIGKTGFGVDIPPQKPESGGRGRK